MRGKLFPDTLSAQMKWTVAVVELPFELDPYDYAHFMIADAVDKLQEETGETIDMIIYQSGKQLKVRVWKKGRSDSELASKLKAALKEVIG